MPVGKLFIHGMRGEYIVALSKIRGTICARDKDLNRASTVNMMMIKVAQLPAYLLAAPGVFLLFCFLNRRRVALLVYLAVGFLLLCVTYYNTRFYIPFLPILLAVPLYLLYGEHSKRWVIPLWGRKISLNLVLYAFIFAGHLFVSTTRTHQFLAEEPAWLPDVARQLKGEVKKEDVMFSRKPHLGYLAGIQARYFPNVSSIEELRAAAREQGATLILYGPWELSARPALRFLLEGHSPFPGLTLVRRFDKLPLIVYRVTPR